MIETKLSSLRGTKFHEYATRFLLGGICTATGGVIAKHFGPTVGGLFLAFPAIFPASANLIENHEKRVKADAGFDGTIRWPHCRKRRCLWSVTWLCRPDRVRRDSLEGLTSTSRIRRHPACNGVLANRLDASMGISRKRIYHSGKLR